MAALLQRLDRLTAALEAAPRATGAATQSAAPERTIVAGESDALRACAVALETIVAALQRSALHGGVGVMPGAGAAPAMRTPAVQQLRQQLEGDEKEETNEALRSFLVLGPGQVLDRLGSPTEVHVNDSKWIWQYGRRGEDPIWVTFSLGIVMNVEN